MARRRQGSPCTNGSNTSDSEESKESPKSNANSCQHCGKRNFLVKGLNVLKLRKVSVINEYLSSRHCKQCKADDNSNPEAGLYMCLQCGQCACDDGEKNHAAQHYAAQRSDPHFLGLHLNNWTLRCFKCNEVVDPATDKKIPELIDSIKQRASKLNDKQDKNLVNSSSVKEMNGVTDEDSSSNFHKKKLGSSAFSNTAKPRLFTNKMRVKGLSNLGNTCFFNSVLQCLAQTPFLLDLLKEIEEPDEEVILPEKDGQEAVKLVLGRWGPVTEALANTLSEITSPETGSTFPPRKLLDALRQKCPQFQGYDQHDSHELLRHLLECVRVEDLKRYQRQIFAHNGTTSKVNPQELDEAKKEAIKKMNTRIQDTVMLRPEHLFKGTLVSTLKCKSCDNESQTEERFLDLSLPIAGEKPVKKAVTYGNNRSNIKNQRLKRKQVAARQQSTYFSQASPENGQGDSRSPKKQEESDSAEVEDADAEDSKKADGESGYSSEKPGSARVSPIPTPNTPNTPNTPENMCSVTDNSLNSEYSPDNSVNPFENGVSLSVQISPIAVESSAGCGSPDSICANASPGSPSGFEDPHATGVDANSVKSKLSNLDFSTEYRNSYMAAGSSEYYKNHDALDSISEFRENYDQTTMDPFDATENSEFDNNNDHNRTLMPHIENSLDDTGIDNLLTEDSNENSNDVPTNSSNVESPVSNPPESEEEEEEDEDNIVGPSNFMTYSRFQYNDMELSVTSCLNQFTALETMSGSNKVSCENCVKVQNKGKAEKAIYSNASKQFLIRSPPAVLILHLKRFQVMYTSFQKIHRFVSFPLILDIDPYCSDLCREESRAPGKKEILYSLYGVVVHSGCLGGGHYIAYVKARSPPTPDDERLKFVPGLKNPFQKRDKVEEDHKGSAEKELNGTRDSISPESNQEPQWYYISDSHVTEANESDVLKCEAYLLFYERIL